MKKKQSDLKLNKNTKIKLCASDATLHIITTLILLAVLIIVAYPVIFIVSSSFSSSAAIASGRVILWPVKPSIGAYQFVFQYKNVYIGYANTIIYTVLGTFINIIMSVLAAYPLSKRGFQGRNLYMTVFFITMLVGAGMIPNYLIKSKFGLINNVLVMLIPGAIGTHNMIIIRTAFQNSIPGELFEAAKIDGASDFQCLYKIAMPLAKPTISVVTLYYAVGHWNSYFTAMIYFRDKNLWPLQLFLRNLLAASAGIEVSGSDNSSALAEMLKDGTEGIKYALIVVSTVPVLILYGIVQKYFKKGVMIGAVKG